MALTGKAAAVAHQNHLDKEDWDRFTGLGPNHGVNLYVRGRCWVCFLFNFTSTVSTNHGDTCCYFRLVIIAIFCTAKRIATAHSHTFYIVRISAFTAQLISSEPFAEPNPKCMKSVCLGLS